MSVKDIMSRKLELDKCEFQGHWLIYVNELEIEMDKSY